MFSIGEWMYDLFGPYGSMGVILFVFLIFYIDSVIFPTLPEIFIIVGFMYSPSLTWGLVMLLTAMVAEIAGVTTLYVIVEYIHVPHKIKHVAKKYTEFLILSDERAILMNRFAPMIPFTGAFLSLIDSWSYGRGIFYLVIGCVVKYGMILLFANFFYAFFQGPAAEWMTIGFVIGVMILSLIATYYRKKKRDKEQALAEEKEVTENEGS